jgi:hypothetical protein
MAVSVASMLAPEEVYKGSGKLVGESELTPDDRKRRRAQKKRSRKGFFFFFLLFFFLHLNYYIVHHFKLFLYVHLHLSCPLFAHMFWAREILSSFHLVSFAVCFFHVCGLTMRNSYILVALYS